MASPLGPPDPRPGRGGGLLTLRLDGVTKRFGDVGAVRDLTLDVAKGEFLTLLGPSGCGKTTALRLIAGFETPDAGTISFDGRDVTGRSPQRRGFGMVFQSYALFPHLDVFENLAFGLRTRGLARDDIERRVEDSLRRVNLTGLGARQVQALSGGQQQRVALARALAIQPPLLLLDEPLSNLDAALREQTRIELRDLVKALGITAVFVTHDQEEAFALSDRVAVLEAGRLRQIGTPEELYRGPADAFVATFVGRANLLPARPEPAGGRVRIGDVLWAADGDAAATEDVVAMYRPEDLTLVGPDEAGALRGSVRDRRFAGAFTSFLVRIDAGPLEGIDLEVIDEDRHEGGDRVGVRPRGHARARVLPAGGAAPGA